MNARPAGVTLLALLLFLNVAVYVVLGGLSVFQPAVLARILQALSPSGAGPEKMHAAMGAWQPVYYLAGAVLCAAVALGLWTLRNWARLIILALVIISLLGLPMESMALLKAPATGAIILTLVRIALSVFWIWYLMSKRVRTAFQTARLAEP